MNKRKEKILGYTKSNFRKNQTMHGVYDFRTGLWDFYNKKDLIKKYGKHMKDAGVLYRIEGDGEIE